MTDILYYNLSYDLGMCHRLVVKVYARLPTGPALTGFEGLGKTALSHTTTYDIASIIIIEARMMPTTVCVPTVMGYRFHALQLPVLPGPAGCPSSIQPLQPIARQVIRQPCFCMLIDAFALAFVVCTYSVTLWRGVSFSFSNIPRRYPLADGKCRPVGLYSSAFYPAD